MDLPDFLAALDRCLADSWRQFNMLTIWGVAFEEAERRVLLRRPARG